MFLTTQIGQIAYLPNLAALHIEKNRQANAQGMFFPGGVAEWSPRRGAEWKTIGDWLPILPPKKMMEAKVAFQFLATLFWSYARCGSGDIGFSPDKRKSNRPFGAMPAVIPETKQSHRKKMVDGIWRVYGWRPRSPSAKIRDPLTTPVLFALRPYIGDH